MYLKKNRGATIAAKEPKCSPGGGGTPEHLQRDRERDHCRSSVAGGETTRRQGAGVDISPEVAERERETAAARVLACSRGFLDGVAVVEERNGGGAVARWWPELQRLRARGMEERNGGEKWRSCAREEERGCSFEP